MARLSRVRVVSVVWIAELQNLFQYFASLPIQGLRCLVIREMNGESLRPPTQSAPARFRSRHSPTSKLARRAPCQN